MGRALPTDARAQELDAYMKTRLREDDPMANMKDTVDE
jgi:hypothetical protein